MASKQNSRNKSNSDTVLNTAKGILSILINLVVILVLVYIVLNVSRVIYDTSYNIFGNTGVTEGEGIDVFIKVEQGESTMNVARKLEQNKVIDNPYSFYIHAKLKEYSIMPGTFALNTSMNYDDIFAIITVPYLEEELEEQDSSVAIEKEYITGEPIVGFAFSNMTQP